MPEEVAVPEYGLGYEIFHKMKLRKEEIFQVSSAMYLLYAKIKQPLMISFLWSETEHQ